MKFVTLASLFCFVSIINCAVVPLNEDVKSPSVIRQRRSPLLLTGIALAGIVGAKIAGLAGVGLIGAGLGAKAGFAAGALAGSAARSYSGAYYYNANVRSYGNVDNGYTAQLSLRA